MPPARSRQRHRGGRVRPPAVPGYIDVDPFLLRYKTPPGQIRNSLYSFPESIDRSKVLRELLQGIVGRQG